MSDVGVEHGEADELLGAGLAVVGAAEALEAAVGDRRGRDVQVAQLAARAAHLGEHLRDGHCERSRWKEKQVRGTWSVTGVMRKLTLLMRAK